MIQGGNGVNVELLSAMKGGLQLNFHIEVLETEDYSRLRL